MKKDTKLIHKGRKSTEHFGTVNPPIYQSSTILFPTVEAYEDAEEKGIGHYDPIFGKKDHTDPAYGISGSQTTFALQDLLAELEGGDACFLTSSGLSAITSTLTGLLKSGDHALIVDSVYGPTRRFCNKTLAKFGVEIEYYSSDLSSNIEELVKDNTRVIFLESPGSLTFEVQDIQAIAEVAKKRDIYTIIDNSWATPLYLNPLDFGIDISIHAITKYINGSSDLLMGAVITNKRSAAPIHNIYKAIGMTVAPQECYLALRGTRTLKARLEYQERSLRKVISAIESLPQVKKILAPCHKDFEGYKNWKKYFTGTTSLFSIELDKEYSFEEIAKMINNYKYFGIGASWGGFESLVRYFRLDGEIRSINTNVSKHSGSLLRYYIGLEDADDLIEDLKEGFKRLA